MGVLVVSSVEMGRVAWYPVEARIEELKCKYPVKDYQRFGSEVKMIGYFWNFTSKIYCPFKLSHCFFTAKASFRGFFAYATTGSETNETKYHPVNVGELHKHSKLLHLDGHNLTYTVKGYFSRKIIFQN
ncbi:uncharacterized protein LOC144129757 [Amblyomma americanum]